VESLGASGIAVSRYFGTALVGLLLAAVGAYGPSLAAMITALARPKFVEVKINGGRMNDE